MVIKNGNQEESEVIVSKTIKYRLIFRNKGF